MYNPHLIQNDMTQAPSLTRYRPTGSITASVMCVTRSLAYIRLRGVKRLNRTSELQTAAVETECAHVKSRQGGSDFLLLSSQLSVRLLQSAAAFRNERCPSAGYLIMVCNDESISL